MNPIFLKSKKQLLGQNGKAITLGCIFYYPHMTQSFIFYWAHDEGENGAVVQYHLAKGFQKGRRAKVSFSFKGVDAFGWHDAVWVSLSIQI